MARMVWWVAVALSVVAGVSPAAARAEAGATAPLADDPTLIALAVALACADAPTVGGAIAPAAAGAPAQTGPELELVATVRAKTLQFDEVPKVDVVFHGNGPRKTVWKTERVNLPAKPEPGVVYRDVVVRLTVTSDLEELTSLLRQAKRASAGVRVEGGAVPAVVPAGAPRPMEIAPPAVPAAPAAPAPVPAVHAAPAAAVHAAPAPAAPAPPAPAAAAPADAPAALATPAASAPLLAPAPQPVVAPAPPSVAPPAPPPVPAAPPAR